jgi:hypothetical protein
VEAARAPERQKYDVAGSGKRRSGSEGEVTKKPVTSLPIDVAERAVASFVDREFVNHLVFLFDFEYRID